MGLLTKRNYNPLTREFGDFDNIIDDFFGRNWGSSLTFPNWDKARLANIARYPIRTKKNEDGSLRIEFDVPGLDKNDVEIHYDEDSGILSVSSAAEEKSSDEDSKSTARHTFSYQVSAYDLDSETIEAVVDKGVLTIVGRPIKKQASRKRIEIK